jgi:WD40 repeat protein
MAPISRHSQNQAMRQFPRTFVALASLLLACAGGRRTTVDAGNGRSPEAGAADVDPGASDGASDSTSDASVPATPLACSGTAFGAGVRSLATAGRVVVAGHEDGRVIVRGEDLAVAMELAAHATAVRHVALDGTGKLLATTEAGGQLRLWSLPAGRQLWSRESIDAENGLAIARNGSFVLAYSSEGVRVHDAGTGRETLRLSVIAHRAFFAADGSRVFVFTDTGLLVHDSASGNLVRRVPDTALNKLNNYLMLPSPSGDLVVAAGWYDKLLLVLRTSDLSVETKPLPALSGAWPLAFSPDGATLVVATLDNDGRKSYVPWRTSDWTPGPAWTRPASGMRVQPGPTPGALVLAEPDGVVHVVDAATGATIHRAEGPAGMGHPDEAVGIRISRDGRTIVTQGAAHLQNESALIVWDAATRKPRFTVPTAAASLHNFDLTPQGQLVVAGSDGIISVFDVERGQLIRKLGMGVTAVATSPAGDYVYAGGQDATVRRYSIADGGAMAQLVAGLSDAPSALTVSPSGEWLAVGARRAPVSVFRADDGSAVWGPGGVGRSSGDPTLTLAFSPDSRLVGLATHRTAETFQLFEAATGEPVRISGLFPMPRGTLSFSANGKLLALGGGAGLQLIRLSDRTFAAHPELAPGASRMPVAFSPVADELLVSGAYGQISSLCGLVARHGGP